MLEETETGNRDRLERKREGEKEERGEREKKREERDIQLSVCHGA